MWKIFKAEISEVLNIDLSPPTNHGNQPTQVTDSNRLPDLTTTIASSEANTPAPDPLHVDTVARPHTGGAIAPYDLANNISPQPAQQHSLPSQVANEPSYLRDLNGYRIPFEKYPSSVVLPNNKSVLAHSDFVDQAILDLIQARSVLEVNHPPYVVNPLTVSVNSENKCRLILDLRHVNKCIAKTKFKMEDALRHWRSQGIPIVLYLDDGVVCLPTFSQVQRASCIIQQDPASAGVVVNDQKSVWIPQQSLEWLGILLDLDSNVVSIPIRGINGLIKALNSLRAKFPFVTPREVASVTGKIVSLETGVGNIAFLMSKFLQSFVKLHGDQWDLIFDFSAYKYSLECSREIEFWLVLVVYLDARFSLSTRITNAP
ncbi:predicted protein [Nematostella vectensis]|uniref:Uncharacterized protein n=1 Tax=Nematostella vectensis TaxID=45351 RepID=A7SLA7_NEMVE|nr:predicted protein [Nematostella vectensis]|eukprot:XP_001627585.1 predicted protein [Nematostella vectensis]